MSLAHLWKRGKRLEEETGHDEADLPRYVDPRKRAAKIATKPETKHKPHTFDDSDWLVSPSSASNASGRSVPARSRNSKQYPAKKSEQFSACTPLARPNRSSLRATLAENTRESANSKTNNCEDATKELKQKKVFEDGELWNTLVDVGIDKRIMANAMEKGWKNPLLVQHLIIPPILEGHNVVASALTGQGKTGSYAIPLIQRMLNDEPIKEIEKANLTRRIEPKAIVLVPTAELARQVEKEFNTLGTNLGVTAAAMYSSGETLDAQIKRCTGAQILVATAGRVLSHCKEAAEADKEFIPSYDGLEDSSAAIREKKRRFLSLAKVQSLVLDECDRLLAIENLPDVMALKEMLPKPVKDNSSGAVRRVVGGLRQTVVISATLPTAAHEFIMAIAGRHELFDLNRKMKVPPAIKQIAYTVSHERKLPLLTHLLNRKKGVALHKARTLVFVRTAVHANRVAYVLCRSGHKARPLHASLKVQEKMQNLEAFASGECQVLIATDIATRGLDIPNIDYVVNFDVPCAPEEYLHRVGRTGRAGAPGTALTFIDKEKSYSRLASCVVGEVDEKAYFQKIVNYIGGQSEFRTWNSLDKSDEVEYQRTGIERRKIPGIFIPDLADFEALMKQNKEARAEAARLAAELAAADEAEKSNVETDNDASACQQEVLSEIEQEQQAEEGLAVTNEGKETATLNSMEPSVWSVAADIRAFGALNSKSAAPDKISSSVTKPAKGIPLPKSSVTKPAQGKPLPKSSVTKPVTDKSLPKSSGTTQRPKPKSKNPQPAKPLPGVVNYEQYMEKLRLKVAGRSGVKIRPNNAYLLGESADRRPRMIMRREQA